MQTPDFVQVTGKFLRLVFFLNILLIGLAGVGDLTQLNIPAGNDGGELDPHGADGNGMSVTLRYRLVH